MITLVKLQALFADLGPKAMQQVFSDWEMLVGFEATASLEPVHIISGVAEVADKIDDSHILIETHVVIDESDLGPVYIVFSNALVVEIIADLLMIPANSKAAKVESGLSEGDLEAFQEMANMLCGSWNRVFQEQEKNLRVSQSVDDLNVVATMEGTTPMLGRVKEGRMAWIETTVVVGDGSYPSLLLFPFEVAIGIAEEVYSISDPRSSRNAG